MMFLLKSSKQLGRNLCYVTFPTQLQKETYYNIILHVLHAKQVTQTSKLNAKILYNCY